MSTRAPSRIPTWRRVLQTTLTAAVTVVAGLVPASPSQSRPVPRSSVVRMWDVERIERDLLNALATENVDAAESFAKQYVASSAPIFSAAAIDESYRTPIERWVNAYLGIPQVIASGESFDNEHGRILGKHLEVATKLASWANDFNDLDAALLAANLVAGIDADTYLEPAIARDGYLQVVDTALVLGDRLDPENLSDYRRLFQSRALTAAGFFSRDPSRHDWAKDARRYADELMGTDLAVAQEDRAVAFRVLAIMDKKYIPDAIDAWNDFRSFVYERYEANPDDPALFRDGGMFEWTPANAEMRRASELGGIYLRHGMYKTAADISLPYTLNNQAHGLGGMQAHVVQNYTDALLGQVVTFDAIGNRVVDADASKLFDKAIATMTSFVEKQAREQGLEGEDPADDSTVREIKDYRDKIISDPTSVPLTWNEFRDLLSDISIQRNEQETDQKNPPYEPATAVPERGPGSMGR